MINPVRQIRFDGGATVKSGRVFLLYNKLLMTMALTVCVVVGSAQELPKRTLGRRLQRPVASTAPKQELHKTTTNGVEWTYEVVDGGVFLGSGDRLFGRGTRRLSDGKKAKLAIPQGTAGNLIVPETLDGIQVRGIGMGAFSCCSNLTSVAIPSSVISIDDSAFSGCRGLKSFVVDPGNQIYSSINGLLCSKDGRKLIWGVNGDVAIPSSVTNIGDSAFYGCSSLTSLAIPESVTSIECYAFSGCGGLTSMTIASSLKNVDFTAFVGCTNLKTVDVLKDGKSESLSFDEYCNRLNSAKADGVEWTYAVDGGGVVLGSGEWRLDRGKKAKLAVPQSTSGALIIPDTLSGMPVRGIGIGAFSGCSNLTSVTIPSSVTSIRERAFEDCVGLASLTIPSGVTSIDASAFSGCRGLKSFLVDPENQTYSSNNGLLCSKDGRTLIRGVNGDVEIPTCVTNIGYGAFKNCSRLMSIKIPSSVDNVGYDAFKGCSGLTSLEIADGVNSIGSDAFSGCSNLTSVTIPSSVKNVGWRAFSNCAGLREVTLSEGVTNVDSGAFERCRNLTSIMLPMSLKTIESSAFRDCRELRSVKIPPSVATLKGSPFWGCSKLETITIPPCVKEMSDVISAWDGGTNIKEVVMYEGVPSIGRSMFERMTSLKSVAIPSSVTNIGDYAFRYCSGLTSVTIPTGVRKIGKWAFSGCSGLTSVTMPSGLKNIDATAFSGCKNLKTVDVVTGGKAESLSFDDFCKRLNSVKVNGVEWTYEVAGDGVVLGSGSRFVVLIEQAKKAVPRNTSGALIIPDTIAGLPVRGIGFGAFSCCSNLTSVTIPSSVTSIGNQAFAKCVGLTSVKIPSSVTSIGEEAFEDCAGLVSLTIPSSVTSIGDSAFSGCRGLKFFTVDPKNQTYSSINGLLCSKDGRTLVQYVIGDGTIPPCVTSIGEGAFSGCSGLTSLTIPSSVTSIGERAFAYCSGLTSVTIPSSVTNVMRGAFAGCSDLTSVTIPSSVTSIGKWAFGWSGLTSVTIPSSVTNIMCGAFTGCSRMMSFVVDPKNPAYCSINGLLCSKDGCNLIQGVNGDVKIPACVTNIDESAFKAYEGLASVMIPSSVKNIGDWAFDDCRGLTSVKIMSGVRRIGSAAFSGCTNLTSVTIPSSVMDIGEGVFGGCGSLTNIAVLSSKVDIGRWAFEGTPFYKNMSDGLVIFENGLLYTYKGKCPSSIKIPMNVSGINMAAFYKFNALESIDVDCDNPSFSAVDGLLYNKSKTDLIRCPVGKKGGVTIPSSVTSIGDCAFDVCGGIASVVIPSSVTNVGRSAFSRCKELASLTIPSCVTNVHPSAFSGCSKLETVNIVKEGKIEPIPFDEFCEKWNLDKPRLNWRRRLRRTSGSTPRTVAPTNGGNSVTNGFARQKGVLADGEYEKKKREAERAEQRRQLLNAWATGGGSASGLLRARRLQRQREAQSAAERKNEGKPVVVSESCTTNKAVCSCTNTQGAKDDTKVVKGTNEVDGITWFYSIVNGEATIVSPTGEFGACAVSPKPTGKVTVPSSFDGAPVTAIGKHAFRYCREMKAVKIPASVRRIGKDAFWGTALKSVAIPPSVEAVEDGAFCCCLKMTSVVLPERVSHIGGMAFYQCRELESVTIPASVKSIGGEAFLGCRELESVTMRGERPDVKGNVFDKCENLAAIHVPANAKSWKGMKKWQGIPLVFDTVAK